MQLPSYWKNFEEEVLNRVNTLCKSNIWGLQRDSLRAWFNNFQKEEHKYLALHILDRLTYRSKDMAHAAYSSYVRTKLKSHAADFFGINQLSMCQWLEGIRRHGTTEFENLKLIAVSKKYDTADSGKVILRMLTSELFNQSHELSCDELIAQGHKGLLIILIDDFVGSGQQFIDFARDYKLSEIMVSNKVLYAPLMAYKPGIDVIAKAYPNLNIEPLEVLDESDHFFSFSDDKLFCGDDEITEQEFISCYEEIRVLSGHKKSMWYGRDKLCLTVAFEWGVPNQSLGCLWLDSKPNWHNLVCRRER